METRLLDRIGLFPRLRLAASLLQTVSPTHFKHTISPQMLTVAQAQLLHHFSLNESQQQALQRLLAFFHSEPTTPSIQLIQGAFGSGKSFFLCSLLILLQSLQALLTHSENYLGLVESGTTRRSHKQPQLRILFCSHTNVAVDRVCSLLRDHDFQAFSRTGNQRRIDPSIREFYRAYDSIPSDHVICTTICSLPSEIGTMDIVVVDEATQVSEYYVRRCYSIRNRLCFSSS